MQIFQLLMPSVQLVMYAALAWAAFEYARRERNFNVNMRKFVNEQTAADCNPNVSAKPKPKAKAKPSCKAKKG
jgi:hypothetical protein